MKFNYKKSIKGLAFTEDAFYENGKKRGKLIFDNNCKLISLANKYLKYCSNTQTGSYSTLNMIARDICYLYDFLIVREKEIADIDIDLLVEYAEFLTLARVRPFGKEDVFFRKHRYSIERACLTRIPLKEKINRELKIDYFKDRTGLSPKSIYRIFERAILYLRYLNIENEYLSEKVISYFNKKNSVRMLLKSQGVEIHKHEIAPVEDGMIFSVQEVENINKSASAPYERFLYFILEKTGIRIGEALGLKIFSHDAKNLRDTRGDVYYKQGCWVIEIVWRSENDYFCRTKSHKNRGIQLKQSETPMFELLLERYLKWREEKLKGKYNEWLFISNHGNQLTQNTAYIQFKRTLSKAHLARRTNLTLHTYRHTFATKELLTGTPIEIVSQILGHEDSLTTEKIYTHYTSKELLEVREKIERKSKEDFNDKM